MLVWLKPIFGDFSDFQNFPCLSFSALSIRWQLWRVGHRVYTSHHHQDTVPVSAHVCLWASHLIPPPSSQPRNPISHTQKRAFYLPIHTLRVKAEVGVTLPVFSFCLFSFPCLSHLSIRCKLWRVGHRVHMSHHQVTITVSVHMCLNFHSTPPRLSIPNSISQSQKRHFICQFTLSKWKLRRESLSYSFFWLESNFAYITYFLSHSILKAGFRCPHESLWRYHWGLCPCVYYVGIYLIPPRNPISQTQKEQFICQFTLSKWKLSCEWVLFCFCFWWG